MVGHQVGSPMELIGIGRLVNVSQELRRAGCPASSDPSMQRESSKHPRPDKTEQGSDSSSPKRPHCPVAPR